MMHEELRNRAVVFASLAALAAGLLGGCSASGPESSNPVTIEFWSGIPAAVQAAEAYNASQDEVIVNVSNPPDTAQKLSAALTAGTGAPDLSGAQYTDMPAFIATGGLAELSQFDLDQDSYLPFTWTLVGSGDQVYGIPEDIGPAAMVYREDVLKQYGLEPAKTWDEFAEQAQQIFDASGGETVIANFPPNYADWFLALAWQRGGKPWQIDGDGYSQNFDNAAARDVAEFLQPLIENGLVTTYPQFSADLYNALAKGEIATSMEAAWGAGGWAQNLPADTKGLWRVADLPQVDEATFAAANLGGSALIVPKEGEHQEEAVEFAKWLTATTDGTQIQYDISGTFSASLVGQDLPSFGDPEKNPSVFFGGQNVAEVYAKAASGVDQEFVYAPWYLASTDAYTAAFAGVFTNEKTIRDALADWQAAALADAESKGYQVTAGD